MKSSFYYGKHHKKIEKDILDYINAQDQFLSGYTADSPRAVGDAVCNIIAAKLGDFLGDWCKEYSTDFARRAMADMAFTDKEGIYSVVDVKTHREDTKFNMPNLISVERLSRFYESDTNVFSVLMVKYGMENDKLVASKVIFSPLEFFDWNCLTIGALGWGQIQIANAGVLAFKEGYSRKDWMLELCKTLMEFYPKEVAKIHGRMNHFEDVRKLWEQKEDIWR